MKTARCVYFDVLRAVAMVRVVVFHTIGYGALSVVFPAMGVMFALAGSLMARTLDRAGPRAAVTGRLRRLLPVLWVLGAIGVSVMVWHGWSDADYRPLNAKQLLLWLLPVVDPPASDWGVEYFAAVLWYLRTYLWLVLLSPLLLPLFRRWPIPTLLAPLAALLVIGLGYVRLESLAGTALYDLVTWMPCWLLGFAHRDGMLHRLKAPVVAGLALLSGALAAVWYCRHPSTDMPWDLNAVPLANVLWSIAFLVVLLRWRPQMAWLTRTRPLHRLVGVLNARAVTIYLWHMPAVLVAVLLLDRLGLGMGLESQAALLGAVWLVTGMFVLALGWVEDLAARRRPRLLPDPYGPPPAPRRHYDEAGASTGGGG